MDRRDQKKLTRNMILVKKTIQKDLETITQRLVQEKVFSGEIRQEIMFPRQMQARCGVFINKLIRAGPNAFSVFRKVLEERGYSHLVNTMENSVPPEISTWMEEREKTFVIDRVQTSRSLKVQNKDSQAGKLHRLERMMTLLMMSNIDENEDVQQERSLSEFDVNKNHLVRSLTNQSTFVMS